MPNSLKHLHILITRPQQKAKTSQAYFNKYGATSSILPMIAIQPNIIKPHQKSQQYLSQYQHLIFVSVNAVDVFCKQVDITAYQNIKCWSIGKVTQAKLAEYGLTATTVSGANSEQLWHNMASKIKATDKILLVAGKGGRRYLSNKFSKNNIYYRKLSVYTRTIIDYDAVQINQALQICNIITITSAEILFALIKNIIKLSHLQQQRAFKLALVTISARVAKIATKLGFNNVFIAQGVDSSAFVKSMLAIKL